MYRESSRAVAQVSYIVVFSLLGLRAREHIDAITVPKLFELHRKFSISITHSPLFGYSKKIVFF